MQLGLNTTYNYCPFAPCIIAVDDSPIASVSSLVDEDLSNISDFSGPFRDVTVPAIPVCYCAILENSSFLLYNSASEASQAILTLGTPTR